MGLGSIKGLRIEMRNVMDVKAIRSAVGLVTAYASVFDDVLGIFKRISTKITIEDNVEPRFFMTHPVSFAMIDRVNEELMRMEQVGVQREVKTSNWASPIVSTLKWNGQIQIRGDFNVTVNPVTVPRCPGSGVRITNVLFKGPRSYLFQQQCWRITAPTNQWFSYGMHHRTTLVPFSPIWKTRGLNDQAHLHHEVSRQPSEIAVVSTRGALALMFGVTKFRQYIWRREFEAVMNYKQLLGLLSLDKRVPEMCSPRIMRWALMLRSYCCKLM
ncbi:hypothetical protein MRX96_004562 [Rhipicephalus microplus]